MNARRRYGMLRVILTSFAGILFGFRIGVSVQTLSKNNKAFQMMKLGGTDIAYIDDNYSDIDDIEMSSKAVSDVISSSNRQKSSLIHDSNQSRVWVSTNPRGAEMLPPGILESESDLHLRKDWGIPNEELIVKPKYLVTFTVGYELRYNIDKAVKKFSENFMIMLFHYDGRMNEWDEFEWLNRAIHISALKQTKWWYAKRFLHPDIVAPYDYIFIWDEDLGLENFDAEEYLRLVNMHGLEISQPGLVQNSGYTWQMTRKRYGIQVHKNSIERHGWYANPNLPPCAAFVEIMAPVFSRDAWRCVWQMIQNDLVHGWGLDFAFRKCVEPAHEKIGVVDAQWIVHKNVPTLGNQGQAENGRAPWVGVRRRCKREWTIFQNRMAMAEKTYFAELNSARPNL